MVQPCEIAVKVVVPAIRSALAQELTRTYGLKQREVANLLGLTQTAVSKYTTGVRGRVIKVEKIREAQIRLREIAGLLAEGHISKYQLAVKVCSTCEVIRHKRIMCESCLRVDPAIIVEKCVVCSPKPASSPQ